MIIEFPALNPTPETLFILYARGLGFVAQDSRNYTPDLRKARRYTLEDAHRVATGLEVPIPV